MIEQVIDGVVGAIVGHFGEEYPCYTDNAEQGLNPGSFSVMAARPTQQQFLGSRYMRRTPICVYYFPKTDGDYAEMNAVIEKLLEALEMIEVSGDPVRGTNMDPHVEDGVLCFSVDYNFFVRRTPGETTHMEEIEMRERIHG